MGTETQAVIALAEACRRQAEIMARLVELLQPERKPPQSERRLFEVPKARTA